MKYACSLVSRLKSKFKNLNKIPQNNLKHKYIYFEEVLYLLKHLNVTGLYIYIKR